VLSKNNFISRICLSAASLIFPVNILTVLRQSVVGGKRQYELPFVLIAITFLDIAF